MDNLDKSIYDEVISIGGEKFTIGELLGVDENNLSEEYAVQAGRYAWVGAMAAKAEALYNEAKAAKDAMYSSIDLELRDKYRDVKTTEARIRAMVLEDEDYLDAVSAENEALQNYRLLRNLLDALKQRGDMLVSLGAHMRQEFEYANFQLYKVKDKLRGMKDE